MSSKSKLCGRILFSKSLQRQNYATIRRQLSAAMVDSKLYSPKKSDKDKPPCGPSSSCQQKKSSAKPEDLRVDLEDARRFITECLVAVKTPECHASQQADLLIEADYRGHYSHGMNRLEMYINDISMGSCDTEAVPKIVKESAATAWVDGRNALGAVAGNFCMDLALKKAQECGIGFVAARNTNHYGIAGWYTIRAARRGMIGFSATNTSPFMGPTRSKAASLGTNPLSLAAPAAAPGTSGGSCGASGGGDEKREPKKDMFVLDMATTAVAVGKLEIARRKGAKIPLGWAQGPDGKPTADTELALKTATLMPLGGDETNSGYKGYGLGVLVEILGSMLSDAHYGQNIRKWSIAGSKDLADLGQSFMAINPECFAPDFENRMADLMRMLRGLPSQDPEKPVLVAGDPERAHMLKVKEEGGLYYVENQIKTCQRLSEKLKVKMIEQFGKKTGKCE